MYIRADLTCSDTVEVPYFSAGIFEDVCIHCATREGLVRDNDLHPTCQACKASKQTIRKRKQSVVGGAEKNKNKKSPQPVVDVD